MSNWIKFNKLVLIQINSNQFCWFKSNSINNCWFQLIQSILLNLINSNNLFLIQINCNQILFFIDGPCCSRHYHCRDNCKLNVFMVIFKSYIPVHAIPKFHLFRSIFLTVSKIRTKFLKISEMFDILLPVMHEIHNFLSQSLTFLR